VNYTVRAAARTTGVSESRLRTWERRYGIPRPNRAPTGRRLYSEEDLALIRRMAALLEAGMSAAQAAEAVQSGASAEPPQDRPEHELVAVMTSAAERYDESSAIAAIREAIRELGWDAALEEVVFPALHRVGLYWQTAALPPASEHFVSELVRREIHAALSALPPAPPTSASVLLACPQDERHDLGLAALSLLLRRAGLRTIYLGADVPASDIIEAWDASRPDAICLSATSGDGLASLIRASRLITAERRALLFVGGPSIVDGTPAAGITLPASLKAAADTIVGRIRGPLQTA
jgi:MerR family transcriptional regulator, light-induced transcriptional regulator